MPRKPRLLLSKSYYHIITRGNNKKTIFEEEDDYFSYLDLIKKNKKENPFDIYHYCLMSNHIHFLVKTGDASGFSAFMKRLVLPIITISKRNMDGRATFGKEGIKASP